MAKKQKRDEFNERTKLQIAKRAGWLCSHPSCRTPTVGATSDGESEINIGTAAHICAAAQGGPRYDANMTREERRSASNGIWMCRDHGTAVDSDDPQFTVDLLREWKRQAQEESWQRVLRNEPPTGRAVVSDSELTVRLRSAAASDLEVLQHTAKWPATSVALTLSVEGFKEPATTRSLANAVTSLDDLIVVAPPGMGKTTTLLQITENILTNGSGTPFVVPLGDWATESLSVLDSILKRPALRSISETDFRTVAAKPGVVLLLDGWNELDRAARERARVQIGALKAELPEIGLVISTRKQVIDIPFTGTHVDLLPLNEDQQIEIATAMRGEVGARIVDQAWRTSGVRELITIPLYLSTLLSLPEGTPFPTTKEEILRRFVAVHEAEPRRAEALRAVFQGFQSDYLVDLAALATRTGNTTIADSNARKSISETANRLVTDNQIVNKPEPQPALDVLVSNHVLIRSGDTPGYSFQHQQFQEWYASHFVEQLMMSAAGEMASDRLKQTLNHRSWEEAILFAIERLARGNQAQQRACEVAILAAFAVDPMLAAEMIPRSTDTIWNSIGFEIQRLVRGWHTPGKADRALGFMIASGRSEFLDLVWPLITHADDQIHLGALRAGKRFRPSLLGSDAAKRLASLSPEVKKNVLHEIAFNSGMDGLDLATDVATDDPNVDVKVTVVDALTFRRANRHVAEVLRNASDEVFDRIAKDGFVETVPDRSVQARLEAARERKVNAIASPHERLRYLVSSEDSQDRSSEVSELIGKMEIDPTDNGTAHLIHKVRERYPAALADGLLIRVRQGHSLTYGADDILASAGLALEDDVLVEIALDETHRDDRRADAAASVLGPRAVGRMIEACLEARKRVRDTDGKYDQAAGDRYHALLQRIAHTSGASVLSAVQERAVSADSNEIAELAELLSRRPEKDDERARPFSPDALAEIGVLVQSWGERMLAMGDVAKRSQIATLATLISCAPSAALLPLLERLLDDNLQRYRAFREQASATGWHHGPVLDEARSPHTHEYLRAFLAIKKPETAALMEKYLDDEHFGAQSATVLASQWSEANEPKDDKKFRLGVDFSQVEERRAARASNPDGTSTEAEAIFRVIDRLISEGATDDQKKLAVALGVIASRLPHGQREKTVQTLIALTPRRARADLLLNLVLSGEEIDIGLATAGIAETFEAAKKESWILTQSDGYELRRWLLLLPFVNRPSEALTVIRGMPEAQRDPRFLQEMVDAFSNAPSDEAEEVLFRLAEEDVRFYENHTWHNAVLRRGTLSSARRFIDLAAQGMFSGKSVDDWQIARQISGLMDQYSELREHVYALLKDGPKSRGLTLLARGLSENPDTKGLLLLINFESEHKQSFMSWRTIESVVTEHVPTAGLEGSYSVVPAPAAELRKNLLAMVATAGPDSPAARCLNRIDEIRDEYGAPESEPRHPDLESGEPWPIIMPDPQGKSAG